MTQSTQEQNKALVLRAFDLLFNKRDYAAAEKFWSPHYIQHSAHIEPGREGLFNLIKSLPPTLKYEPGTILAQIPFACVATWIRPHPLFRLDGSSAPRRIAPALLATAASIRSGSRSS